jgi:anti-sigma factor RsiW
VKSVPLIHAEFSDRLLPYLDGQLGEAERREVQEHLEGCRSCSEEIAALRALVGPLRDAGRDVRGGGGAQDRYGCPRPDELTSFETETINGPGDESNWIARHLEVCLRCQREIDLTRLMERELRREADSVASEELFAKVEARLLSRVRQGTDGGKPSPLAARLRSLGTLLLTRAALLVSLAVVIGLWGVLRFQTGPTIVAQRASDWKASGVKETPPASGGTPRLPESAPPEDRSLRSPSGTPTIPSLAAPAPSSPSPPAPAATPPGLPTLVPAKRGEPLKVLVLPTPHRPGVRSAVAAGLREHLETLEPFDREFPIGASVDDLAANKRLGLLFGVRYVLDVAVHEARPGYLVVLRAADAETGGIVARREGHTLDEGTLEAVAGRLAKELRDELR